MSEISHTNFSQFWICKCIIRNYYSKIKFRNELANPTVQKYKKEYMRQFRDFFSFFPFFG